MKPFQKTKMKVAFNVSCLEGGSMGGWARYTSELIHHLELQFSDQLELHLFQNKEKINHSFWEQFSLPRLCAQKGIDLLHAPANGGLCYRGKFKKVLTVHDLFSEEDFRWWDQLSPRAFKNALRYKLDWNLSIRAADQLITVSDYCLNALVEKGHKPAVRIYEGGLRQAAQLGTFSLSKTQEFSEDFFLYVGSADRRKRVSQLVEEFASLKRPIKLVLIGKGTKELAAEKKCARVEAFEAMPNEKLLEYYSHCTAFITYSEKEGFGLPLVEAMGFGKPIFYRGGGSIPEICDQAGIFVGEGGLEGTIKNWQNNLADRKKFSEAALQRGQFFSWRKTAEETFRLYQSVLS